MESFIVVLIWIISVIVLSIIGGELRFRYLKKKSNSKKGNIKQTNNEKDNQGGFHRSDMRPSKKCCNADSYGCICVRCGRCGRKF